MAAGIRITHHHGVRGFHIQGTDGVIVSVQFGLGNYSSGRNDDDDEHFQTSFETAVIGVNGQFIPQDDDDGNIVQGYQTLAEVMALLAKYIKEVA